jgi:hypothetical protein
MPARLRFAYVVDGVDVMPKYHFELKNVITYEFDIEAESEEKAEEMTRDWGRDELEKDITDNYWNTEIWEVE